MAHNLYYSGAPSHTSRSSSSRSSRRSKSSYDYMYPASPTRSTHSSRTSVPSSASSSYSRMSIQTFGDMSRPGYAPGQAPADYFYNRAAQDEWDNAYVDEYGRRVRSTSSRGREFEREDEYGLAREPEYDYASERGGRLSEHSLWRDDDRDDCTVRPSDSISQVSYQSSGMRSRRSEGMEGMRSGRDYHAPSGYSRGYGRDGSRLGDIEESPSGSWRGSDEVHVANGRLVRIEEPDW